MKFRRRQEIKLTSSQEIGKGVGAEEQEESGERVRGMGMSMGRGIGRNRSRSRSTSDSRTTQFVRLGPSERKRAGSKRKTRAHSSSWPIH